MQFKFNLRHVSDIHNIKECLKIDLLDLWNVTFHP